MTITKNNVILLNDQIIVNFQVLYSKCKIFDTKNVEYKNINRKKHNFGQSKKNKYI